MFRNSPKNPITHISQFGEIMDAVQAERSRPRPEHFENFLLGTEDPINGGSKTPPMVLRSIPLSNSANDPIICIIIRPAGVVVSMASVRLRKLAFAS
jgi:hypothetical protein